MRIPATTRYGEKCNDCGGPVEYVTRTATWEHTAALVECPKGLSRYHWLAKYDSQYLAPPEGLAPNIDADAQEAPEAD